LDRDKLSVLRSFVFREYYHVKQRGEGEEMAALLYLIAQNYSLSSVVIKENVERILEVTESPDEFIKLINTNFK